MSQVSILPDRGAVSVTGADAEKLLGGLITNEMALLDTSPAVYAGLLSPQGKILFDFFVVRAGDGYLLDAASRQGGRSRQAALDVQTARRRRHSRCFGRLHGCGRVRQRCLSARSSSRRVPSRSSTRGCRVSACGCSCRVRPEGIAGLGVPGCSRGVPRSSDRAWRSRGRQGLPLRRYVPARGADGPTARRVLHEGMLRGPRSGVAHAAPHDCAQTRGRGVGR